MGEVFLDAFLDTLKVLPFLLIMNFLIELLEYKSDGLNARGILKDGFAPLIGTGVGVVPQCGFRSSRPNCTPSAKSRSARSLQCI